MVTGFVGLILRNSPYFFVKYRCPNLNIHILLSSEIVGTLKTYKEEQKFA